MTRKGTSSTLCCVDQFLMTSECEGQVNTSLVQRRVRIVCSGCTVSCVDFHTGHPERDWTVIPGTRKSRQQHSTISGNGTRSKPENENTYAHDSYSFKILVFRNLLTMSAVKTDVNPRDIGTTAW